MGRKRLCSDLHGDIGVIKDIKVSVVIAGRNDDYGQDFLSRISSFVRSIDHQSLDYPGVFEIVVVEWNPLPDRAGLADVLPCPKNCSVRVITVSNDLHVNKGSVSPVLEFHAKNVGIRRAHGQYTLVTNPDIIFSNELIDYLARADLDNRTVYRTDRYDFDATTLSQLSPAEFVSHAVRKSFVVHGSSGSWDIAPLPQAQQINELVRPAVNNQTWHTNASGDFMLASQDSWHRVGGLYETTQHRWHIDSISLLRFGAHGIPQVILQSPRCIFHQDHLRRPEDVSFGSLNVRELAQKPAESDWGLASFILPEKVLQ